MTYAKAVAAAVMAALTALVTFIGPGQGLDDVSAVGWLTVALAVLGSSGVVWYVENGPAAQYAKAVVAALGGFLTSMIASLEDNTIDTNEVLVAIVAALAMSGVVAVVKNREPV